MPSAIMPVSSALSSAAYGLGDAGRRLDASARRVAAIGSPDGISVDLGHETVQQIQAKVEFEASLRVMSIVDEMLGRLINLKV